MKKSLMMAAALLALVTSASPVRADQLPANYLGQWCTSSTSDDGSSEYLLPFSPEEGGTCERANRLTIKRNALFAIESECRFRSIKKTNDLRANHTKPTKADWTPVMEVLANCEGEGIASVVKMQLIYEKGALTIKSKILREVNTY
jgi:hypothetical protein